MPQGFPGSSPLNPGMVHGLFGRHPPPKRSQTPPTSRRGPTVSPEPPPGAGTGYVRFDEGPLTPLLPLCLRNLLLRFSPLGPPASCATPLRISFVLWSSLVPSWTPLRLRRFVLGWFSPLCLSLLCLSSSCTRIGRQV